MKEKNFIILFVIILVVIYTTYLYRNNNKAEKTEENKKIENVATQEEKEVFSYDYDEEESLIKNDFEITDLGDNKYSFVYNEETFSAIYTEDNWKIVDSYKIKNTNDIKIICQKLIDIHKIHGQDMVSYRTADDMAFEWVQHNLAYEIIPEGNSWKESAKDVDLNPEDQGKTAEEIYKARTGKDFNLNVLAN